MSRRKVTIVGGGNVGATAASYIVESQLADVVLVDIMEGMPQGKALDLMQAAAVKGFDTRIIGTNEYTATAGSEVVVITAGIPRKPGMSRDDLLATNAKIVGGVVEQIARHSPNAVIIVVSNPLDAMTHLTWKKSGFPANRVIGMAGVLDSARYASFIAEAVGCSIKDVRAMVLGGHGDTMVPVPQYTTVNGIPLPQLLDRETIEKINVRTQNGGAEIVKLLQTGSAFYAPAASAVAMVEAILLDTGRILPSCVYLNGEYGLRDLYCGVPAVLGKGGVQKVIELKLTPTEHDQLKVSAAAVEELVARLTALTRV